MSKYTRTFDENNANMYLFIFNEPINVPETQKYINQYNVSIKNTFQYNFIYI